MVETSCLISLQDSQALFSPLGQSSRIKYTCIAASSHYIALGANSGGVYCFHRDGYKYIRILANKEGNISMVRFSRDESCLAVVSGGGHVAFWELNLQEEHGVSKRFHVSSLLKDATIKHVVWDGKGSRLFYGDDLGRVAVAHIPKLSKKFSSGSIFKKPDEIIFQDKEKQPIVQLDFHQEMLLMSTQSRCLLVKFGPSREAVQIGKKPRDGPFGARFHERVRGRPPVVYSARPGGRLWEADIEGTVVSTLKLKDFVSIPPAPIIGVGFTPDFSPSTTKLTQPLNLHHLDILAGRYMVTSLDDKLFLFDPASYRLAAWTCDLTGVLDLSCDGRQLFVLCEGGRRVAGLSFLPLESCLGALVEYGQLKQAHMLVETHSSELAVMLPKKRSFYQPLKTTLEFARSIDSGISDNMQAIETALNNLKESLKGVVVAMETPNEDDVRSQGIEQESPQLESNSVEMEPGGGCTLQDGWSKAVGVVSDRDTNQQDGGTSTGVSVGEGDSSLVEVDLLSYPEVERHESRRVPNDVLPAFESLPGNQPFPEGLPGGKLDDHNMTNEIADVASCDLPNGVQGTSDDFLNLDMQVVFEDTDFDHPTDQPDTVTDQPDTVIDQPNTVTDQPDTVTDQPDTITDQHNAITDQPDTVTDQPDTVTDQPDTVTDQPDSVTDQPDTVTDQPDSATDQPDTVTDQPDTVTDQPDTVTDQPNMVSCDLDTGRYEPDATGLQPPPRHTKSQSWDGSHENNIPANKLSMAPDSARSSQSGLNTSDKSLEHSREEPSVLAAYPENTGIEIPVRGPDSKEVGAIEPQDPYDQKSGPSSLDSGSTCSQSEVSTARKQAASPNFVSSSLTVWSDRVRKLEPDDGEDDVVAVPVRSSSGGSLKEGGGKTKGRKKGSKRKKSSSPSTSFRRMSIPDANVPRRAQSSISIPEEYLPFPEAGLPSTPPTISSLSSSPKTDSFLPNFNPAAFLSKMKSLGSQKEKPDISQRPSEATKDGSSLGQKTERDKMRRTYKSDRTSTNREPDQEVTILGKPMPAAFISKVKSMARQGGQNIGIEPEAIQRPMRKVKKMLSSIANPHQSLPPNFRPHDSVYRNEDYFSGQTRKTGLERMPSAEVKAPSLLQYSFVQTFRTATTNAMRSLEDHDVICSPDRMRQCLRDWLNKLEQFRQHLLNVLVSRSKPSNQVDISQLAEGEVQTPVTEDQVGGSLTEEELSVGCGLGLTEVGTNNKLDVFQTSLYLSLEEGIRGNVTELTTLCVEMDVYLSDGLEGMLLGYGSVVDGQRVRASLTGKDWVTQAACWKTLIEKSEESTSEGDWVVELISDDIDSAVECITQNVPLLSPTLPLYIHKLLQQGSTEAFIDLCVKCYPHIMPWEVAMVCGMAQSDDSIEPRDNHHSTVYVQYLNMLFQEEEVSDIFQSDPQLLLLSLEAVLNKGPSKQLLKTSTGHPISWSHLIHWDHSECLESLLKMAVAMETQQKEAARLLCVKYSYWLGVVQLSVAMADVRKALHTLVHLRDIRLFTMEQKWGQLLKKLDDWKLLLETMKELHLPATDVRDSLCGDSDPAVPTPDSSVQDNTSREPSLLTELQTSGGGVQNRGHLLAEKRTANPDDSFPLSGVAAEGNELSWLGIFRYMLSCLGPSLVSELLSSVDISDVHGGAVERKVHSLLVQLSSIHTQQRALAHTLLEKVDRYLWSPRSTTLSPQLLMTHTLDRHHQQQQQARPPLVTSSSVVSLSSSLEDANCHWGVRAGFSNDGYFGVCAVCRISLLTTISDLQPGVVAFHCGHSFHRNCLPEQACLSCFRENFIKHKF